eukprot:6277001-Prorocentrum_lima.AAC.1
MISRTFLGHHTRPSCGYIRSSRHRSVSSRRNVAHARFGFLWYRYDPDGASSGARSRAAAVFVDTPTVPTRAWASFISRFLRIRADNTAPGMYFFGAS